MASWDFLRPERPVQKRPKQRADAWQTLVRCVVVFVFEESKEVLLLNF